LPVVRGGRGGARRRGGPRDGGHGRSRARGPRRGGPKILRRPRGSRARAGRFGAGLVVAVDVRDGRVAVDGWTRESDTGAVELAERCAAAGARRLLVTST